MDDFCGTKVDSEKVIALIIAWARIGGWVLEDRHKKLASKYKVDTTGVIFAGKIPVMPTAMFVVGKPKD